MKVIKIKNVFQTPIKKLICYSYLIIDKKNSLLFDANTPLKKIKTKLKSKTLTAVFLTHGHWDHFYYIEDYQKQYNCTVYLHQNAIKKFANSSLNCSDTHHINFIQNLNLDKSSILCNNQIIKDESLTIQVLETPGHSDCSLCYIINNKYIITGDAIRLSKITNYDLPTGNYKHLQQTIKLFQSLNENLIVLNGHDKPKRLHFYLKENKKYLEEINE